MDIINKKYLFITLLPAFLFLGIVESKAQVIEDSSSVIVDSLLNIPIETPDFIESASRYLQTKSETPVSSSVISRAEIIRYGYNSLPQLLNSLRDIYLSNDLSYTFLGIRGFGRPNSYVDRIQLLIDGHCINEIIYNSIPVDFPGLDLSMVDKVEVVYGPGSSLYGANAVLGTINIVTRKSLSPNSVNATIRLGSFGEKRVAVSFYTEPFRDLNVILNTTYGLIDGRDFYFSKYDSEETNNGIAEKKDKAEYYGTHAFISYGKFSLTGLIAVWDKDVPTAPWGTDFNSRTNMYDSWRFVEAEYDDDLSFDKNIHVRVFYDQYKYNGVYPYDGIDSWDKNFGDLLGGEAKFLWDILPYYRLTTGIEIKHGLNATYKYWDDYQTYSEFSKPFELYSFFIQNDYNIFTGVNLSFGARYDHYNNIKANFSPRFGIVYSPSQDHIIKFLFGKAYRTPSVYERFYEDPVDGFKTNDQLKSEIVYSTEVSYDFKINSNVNLLLYGFNEEMKNLIAINIDEEDSLQFYNNSGAITSKGIGTELNIRCDNYSGYLRYSHQSATENRDDHIVNSPYNLLKIGGQYQIFPGFGTAMEYIFESRRKTDVYVSLPEVHLANFNLTFTPEEANIELSFQIKNLFNKTIKHPASFETIHEYTLQPGRNYMLSVSYGF